MNTTTSCLSFSLFKKALLPYCLLLIFKTNNTTFFQNLWPQISIRANASFTVIYSKS